MKRIFIVCLLFILLSVPTQAQGTLLYLPLILKSSQECRMTFPTAGILDNFNRLNEGPPPSANWSDMPPYSGMVVDTGQLASDPAGAVAWVAYWNALVDPEGFFTTPTRPTDGNAVLLTWTTPLLSDGYAIKILRNDGSDDDLTIFRHDAGVPTIISGPTIITYADGDSFGFKVEGGVVYAYQKPSGGSWSLVSSVADATYQTARYLTFVVQDTDVRIDDFGGGAALSSGDSLSSMPIESKCMSTTSNGWSFIQPVESTNYVLNPSAEAASNYSSLAGATITRSSTYQKYGRYSYRVQTGSNGQGLSLTLSTLTNSVHYVTARIRGRLPNNTRFIIGTGLKTPILIEKIDDNWNLYGVQFNALETNGRTELRIIQQGNGIGDFYVDGIQVEPLAYWTTYIDGTQEGCAWNGAENASTSTRSGLSLAGGQVKDFYDDYGFLVEKVVGAGSPPQNVNIDDYAILPGGELNSIKVQPRDMSIVGKFIADNELELHDKQQALHLALSSENYPGNQSFKLRFNGARVQKEIKVNYKGGLEGELNAFYQDKVISGDSSWETLYKWIEKASIQLQAPDPYWYETGESAANLDGNDSTTFRIIAGRLKSTGQWNNLGPPGAPGTATYSSVRAIAEDSTYVYIGGDFVNFDNQANCDYICRYNKATGVYSSLGTGADGIVRALAIGPDGTLYAGGNFINIGGVAANFIAKWSGTSWSSLGAGMDNGVRALVIGLDGTLYATGVFDTAGGVACAKIAKWNGTSWSALSTGLNSFGESLAVNPLNGNIVVGGDFTFAGGVARVRVAEWNGTSFLALSSGANSIVYALAFAPNGILYLGGDFGVIGGVTCTNIASWNGTSFSALGSGMNGVVYALAVSQDGILIASGQFTTAGGIALADRLARWNGSSWAHLDIDLPGSPIAYAIYPSKYVDPVVTQKYDLFLGFSTSGTGYFAGKVSITNEGNALAFPQVIFKRTGGTAITVETLKNETTGKELLFDYGLLDGEKLTIDLTPTKKSIISSYFGSRLDAVLANSDFNTWTLIPGSNSITSFCADNFALYPSSLDAYLLWKDKYKSYN